MSMLTLVLKMSKRLGCDAESLMMERIRRNVRHVLSLPPCNLKLRLFYTYNMTKRLYKLFRAFCELKLLLSFRSVLYNFPALLKCNMVIFGEWSYDKILQSCVQFLEKIPDQVVFYSLINSMGLIN
jgi:hypothetical protein